MARMCGIAGVMFKHGESGLAAGRALIDMLDGCQHRGPDSTGFALYEEAREGELKLRFLVEEEGADADGGADDGAEASVAGIRATLEEHGAEIVDDERAGNSYRVVVRFTGDVRKLAYDMEHAATLISIGESLDIRKDVGSAHDVDERFHVREVRGTHGLGHVRLATESEVKPEAAHPFWATGFTDIAIVHNGQITNYWKMRRRLERRGFEFHTDNDSELIAVYLADKLANEVVLEDALRTSIDDLDGTFSFLVSTKDEIGYAKDNLAAKPMIMYENDDLIAIASEEVSLNRLFPGRALDTREPPPGSYGTWSRST